MTTITTTTSTRDIYLSSEERWQLWQVKVAERPQLVDRYEQQNGGDGDDNDDAAATQQRNDNYDASSSFQQSSTNHAPPPLTDGCDLPAWRQYGLATPPAPTRADVGDEMLGCLSVGSGCPLFRRCAQLPTVAATSTVHLTMRRATKWEALRDKLMEQIPKSSPVVARLHVTDATCQAPHPWFERQNVPAIIDGCTDTWDAKALTWRALRTLYGHVPWRVSDTHAEMLTLHTFTKYARTAPEGLTDDAPLALYDSQFHTDERAALLDAVVVPPCFADDLYEYMDDSDEENGNRNDDASSSTDASTTTTAVISRPPWRWILMGGARSGTGLHVDPVGTHAWVTLLEGVKRWVLFPPTVNRPTIDMAEGHDVAAHQLPSAVWFATAYDAACAAHADTTVHILQRAGETVYVPTGWPHVVLNLEPSVAWTQNYATPYPDMTRLWTAVDEEAPELGRALRMALQRRRPDLMPEENRENVDKEQKWQTFESMAESSNQQKEQ